MTYASRAFRGLRSLADVNDRTPVAAVAAFDQWLAAQSAAMRQRWSGYQLRRLVAMRRCHSNFSEIGRAIGVTSNAVTDMFARLPEELR